MENSVVDAMEWAPGGEGTGTSSRVESGRGHGGHGDDGRHSTRAPY